MMCCCGCNSSCSGNGSGCSCGCGSCAGSTSCGCSSWGNGITTLPSYPSQDASFAGYPVTLTIPAFIRRSYSNVEADSTAPCGCYF